MINDQTGIELIWGWLRKWNLHNFFSQVTYTKPNAKYYIDDKGIRFDNWNDTFEKVMMAVVLAYFGGRTTEKATSIFKGKNK